MIPSKLVEDVWLLDRYVDATRTLFLLRTTHNHSGSMGATSPCQRERAVECGPGLLLWSRWSVGRVDVSSALQGTRAPGADAHIFASFFSPTSDTDKCRSVLVLVALSQHLLGHLPLHLRTKYLAGLPYDSGPVPTVSLYQGTVQCTGDGA